MASGESERIGELLIEEGAVTQEELTRAISEGGMKGTALAAAVDAAPHVRRADLAAFLASDFRIPVIEDLRKIQLSADLAKLIPEDLARKHELVPVARLGSLICVAKPNYYNRMAVQEIRNATKSKVKVFQADEDQVRAAIDFVYKGKGADLPAPKAPRRPETTLFRATPPAAREEAALEAIPLISMPEDGAAGKSGPGVLEELVEILDAVKVPSAEYAAASRDPQAKLVLDFEDVFRGTKAVPAYRVL